MRFPFTYDLAVGGVSVAQIEGHLEIETDHSDPNAIGRDADWTVEGIELMGSVPNTERTPGNPRHFLEATVALDDEHWLYERILIDVINRHRHVIDAAWAKELRQRRALARSRFGLAPIAPADNQA